MTTEKKWAGTLPVFFAPDAKTAERVVEFFTAQIRNPNTRKAYMHATEMFAAWSAKHGIGELNRVRPIHVAAYIESLQEMFAPPSVKLQLAAIRMLFDWLVVGQVIPTNPAHSVKGPKHVVRKGKTSVLSAEEARMMINSIGEDSPLSLRDRALVGIMVYTFARVGAVIKMRGAAPGCACMKRAVNATKCPATTTLRNTLTPIWKEQGSLQTPRVISSAPRLATQGSSPINPCRNRMFTACSAGGPRTLACGQTFVATAFGRPGLLNI